MRCALSISGAKHYNQVSIRYLSEHSEIDGSVTTEPRLEECIYGCSRRQTWKKEDR